MPELTDLLLPLFIALLILAVVSLVIGALIRRFSPRAKRSRAKQIYQQQYQKVLNEIQTLEAVNDLDTGQEDSFSELEEKKRTAADLLQKIYPTLDEELSFYQLDAELAQMQARVTSETQTQEIFICPNCGSKVWVGDKFCANCGFRLQG